jgi:serine/threonine-protein kinase RsbW
MHQKKFIGGIEQLAAIRIFVAQAAKDLGADEDEMFACELSIDEAASNAYEHAYDTRGGAVQIELWREGDEIVLSLLNWGTAFEPGKVPEPNLSNKLEERTIGGLGLFLIRQMMDDVSFHFDPSDGNQIVMRRTLGHSTHRQ